MSPVLWHHSSRHQVLCYQSLFWPPSFFCFVLFCFCFLGPRLRHMEVPRLGVQSAYTTATATSDLSHICILHRSSRQGQILNPQHKATDRTRNLMVPSWIRFHCAMAGTLWPPTLELQVKSIPAAGAPLRTADSLGALPVGTEVLGSESSGNMGHLHCCFICFLGFGAFLAAPMACRSFQARDQTCATAGAMADPYPA